MTKNRILDAARSSGDFTTLLQAVEAAGLTDTLSEEGPFTLFAPSDEAFAKLPAGMIAGLLEDKKKLGDVLKYHVVPGRLLAADVARRSALKTAQGGELQVERMDGTVKLSGAKVTHGDLMVDNGVIHVIDTVLIPS